MTISWPAKMTNDSLPEYSIPPVQAEMAGEDTSSLDAACKQLQGRMEEVRRRGGICRD